MESVISKKSDKGASDAAEQCWFSAVISS